MQPFRRDVGEIRNEEGHGNLDLRVVDAPSHALEHERERDAERNAADRNLDELQEPVGDREASALNGRERDREGHEPDAVVHEALALEDRPESLRRRGRADHGGGAHGIRRTQHRAKQERAAGAERTDERPRDTGDRKERRSGETHREHEDREPVLAHLTWGGEEGGRVEKRR
jgi:hypothetical protein